MKDYGKGWMFSEKSPVKTTSELLLKEWVEACAVSQRRICFLSDPVLLWVYNFFTLGLTELLDYNLGCYTLYAGLVKSVTAK